VKGYHACETMDPDALQFGARAHPPQGKTFPGNGLLPRDVSSQENRPRVREPSPWGLRFFPEIGSDVVSTAHAQEHSI